MDILTIILFVAMYGYIFRLTVRVNKLEEELGLDK